MQIILKLTLSVIILLSGQVLAFTTHDSIKTSVMDLARALNNRDANALYALATTRLKQEVSKSFFVDATSNFRSVDRVTLVEWVASQDAAYGYLTYHQTGTPDTSLFTKVVFLHEEDGVWKFHNFPMLFMNPLGLAKRIDDGIQAPSK